MELWVTIQSLFPNFVSFLSFRLLGGCFRFCSVLWNAKHFLLYTSTFICRGKFCPFLLDTDDQYIHRISLFVWHRHLFHSLCMHLNLFLLFSSISKDIVIQFRCKNSTPTPKRERKIQVNSELERKKEYFPKRITIDFVAKKTDPFFSLDTEWREASSLIELWRRVPIQKRTPPTSSNRWRRYKV